MLIAYVDESYDRDHFFLGAALATLEQWEHVSSSFDDIRRRTMRLHGTDPGIEFHAHDLMGGSGPWQGFRGRHREAAGVYRAALAAVREAGVRLVFRGVDVGRLNARFRYPEAPHSVALRHLLEVVDDHTASTGQIEQTIVVADQVGRWEEHQRAFLDYQLHGTAGVADSLLRHISAPINFASSQQCDGLQAIDLAVYLHHRRERIDNPHPAAARTLRRLWSEIEQTIDHSESWSP